MLQIYVIFCICALILKSEYVRGSSVDLYESIRAIPLEYFNSPEVQSALYNGIKFGPEEHEDLDIKSHYEISDQFDFFQNDKFFPLINSPSLGKIIGKTMTSYFNRPFYAFQGIPFAEPPTRFQMSKLYEGSLVEDPDEYYDATYLRPKCLQAGLIADISGSEDCLHLSIYTPDTIFDLSVFGTPVMVFIHGGTFMTGDASLYIPTKLMDKDVIVVVIQYRLGSLGFLSAGTENAPGNMGLMDQVIALRWVQQNIQDFGGDPSQVTLFGQSAGSASVSWLMFSPMTGNNSMDNDGDLFQRIITQSGAAIDAWAIDKDPEYSLSLHADAVGCPTENQTPDDIVECISGMDIDVIVTGSNYVYTNDRAHGGLGLHGHNPVIQNGPYFETLTDDLRVITEHPLKSVENGDYRQVDIMTGSVRDEGSRIVGLLWEFFYEPNDLTNNEVFLSDAIIPLFIQKFGIPDKTQTASNSVRLAFLRDAEMGNWDSMVGGLVDAYGMMFLKTGGWTLASLLSNRNPDLNIYFYSFEFESNDSLFPWYFINTPAIPVEGGVAHADELLYLFYMPSYLNEDDNQIQTIKRMTTLWANFAYYGNPTPPDAKKGEIWQDLVDEWEKFNYIKQNFMLIQDECKMSVDYTLRWNYNSLGEETNLGNMTKEYKIQSPVEENNNDDGDYRTATIALAVTSSVLMLLVVALTFKAVRS